IADYLTRQGIAVLRTDDRGVGKSSGSFPQATMEDFSKDVLAGVDYLKQQAPIDKNKIGLIGHSEGGVIDPPVATQSKDIAFVVMLAGTGVPGDELLLHQNQLIYRAMGIPEKMQEDFLVILREILQILRKTETNSEASQQVKA